MSTRRFVVACALLLSFTGTSAFASAQEAESSQGRQPRIEACQPGIEAAVRRNAEYLQLYAVLAFHQAKLKSLLATVKDAVTYQALLTKAEAVAMTVEGGRMVITLPDGTVVIDTAAPDDSANALPQGNSYEHFVAKTVNENHNSRVAILSAQLYPCGVGVERKISTTTEVTESYLAVRLGAHLDSVGTARLSTAE